MGFPKPRQVFTFIMLFPVLVAVALAVDSRVLDKPVLRPVLATMFPDALRSLVQKPLALAPITPVSLIPTGSGSTDISILRDGRKGPVTIEVTGLPEGVTATVQPIPGEASNTRVEFTASESLGDTDVEAHVTVRGSIAAESASQQLLLRVPKVGRPGFASLNSMILKPGMEETVAVGVRRNGFDGPLVIRAVDPPPGVEVSEATLPAGTAKADIRVIVAKESAEGVFPIVLAMSAYGRTIVSELPLVVDSSPYRIRPLRLVGLKPGTAVTADIPVERSSFMGPIRLAAVNLPSGVTMPECLVPSGQKTASLRFEAGASAMPGVQAVTIRASGGRFEDEGPIVLRVIDANDDGALPRDILAAEAIGRISAGGSLGSRTSASGKDFLRRLYAGSAEGQAAIAQGLDWLSRTQQQDGSWSLSGTANPAALNGPDDPVAATALAVLPFLAEGVTQRRSSAAGALAPYPVIVARGLGFLDRNQSKAPDGSRGMIGTTVMGHAVATLALAEAYGLTESDRLRPRLKAAIARLLAEQKGGNGGWREGEDATDDLATTAWAVMALKTARYAHVTVPSRALKQAARFVDDCRAGPADSRQSLYADRPGGDTSPTSTATGLYIRQLLDWKRGSEPAPQLVAGCASIVQHLPPHDDSASAATDRTFFATQVLRHLESDDFYLWHHLVQEQLVRTQERYGPFQGSWRPDAQAASIRASRIYATTLALLTLQSCYRHLPLYRPVTLWPEDPRDEDPDEDEDLDDSEEARPAEDEPFDQP